MFRQAIKATSIFGGVKRPLLRKNLMHLHFNSTKRTLASEVQSGESDKYWIVGACGLLAGGLFYLSQPPKDYKEQRKQKLLASLSPRDKVLVNKSVEVEQRNDNLIADKELSEPSEEVEQVVVPEENSKASQKSQSTKSEIVGPNVVNKPVSIKELESEQKAPSVVIPEGSKVRVYYKYVLVGGGTSTFSALQSIKEVDPEADILIITDEMYEPYMRTPLSKEMWLKGTEPILETLKFQNWQGREQSLFYENEYEMERVDKEHLVATTNTSNVKIIMGANLDALDVDKKVVKLDNGKRLAYNKILLACGGSPNPLKLSNQVTQDQFGKRLVTFRTLQDFKSLYTDLHSKPETKKTVLVLGGGFLGTELAYALSQQKNVKVVQAFQETGNMSNIFPEYLSNFTSSLLQAQGVEILAEHKLQTLKKLDTDKLQAQLNGNKNLEVDLVVTTFGIHPNTHFLKNSDKGISQLELDPINGGIVVNSELEARSDVFVAGDLASYYDTTLSTRRRVEHYDHAVQSGRLAGANMVNLRQKAYTHQPYFWSDVGPDVGYEAVGRIESNLKTAAVFVKSEKHADSFKKGIVFYFEPQDSEHSKEKLVGAVLFNTFGKVNTARALLRLNKFQSTDVDALAAQFELFGEEDH